jgi:hypothetical protein
MSSKIFQGMHYAGHNTITLAGTSDGVLLIFCHDYNIGTDRWNSN